MKYARPHGPPPRPPLAVGDLVMVAYRTGTGPAGWAGDVVEVDDRRGTARVVALAPFPAATAQRSQVVAVKGAAYVEVVLPASERAVAQHCGSYALTGAGISGE